MDNSPMSFEGTTKDALWNERVTLLIQITTLEQQVALLRETLERLKCDITDAATAKDSWSLTEFGMLTVRIDEALAATKPKEE